MNIFYVHLFCIISFMMVFVLEVGEEKILLKIFFLILKILFRVKS